MNTAGTFIPFYLLGFALPLGTLVLLVGLGRERIAPLWMIGALAISAIAFALGMALYSMPVLIVASAALLVGLGSLGGLVLRESLEEWEHTPSYHGFRPVGAH